MVPAITRPTARVRRPLRGWRVASVLLFMLSGAAAPAIAAEQDPSVPHADASAPVPDELLSIPAELADSIRNEVVARSAPGMPRLQRLFAFLTGSDGLALRYNPLANRSVAETYRERDGNCVTLTLFLLAVAPLAELKAYPQESNFPVDFTTHDTAVIDLGHVTVAAEIDGRTWSVDLTADRRWEGSNYTRISLERLTSTYYNNVAVRQVNAGDHAAARASLAMALAADPANDAAWNTLGVVDLRDGDVGAAQGSFQRVLARDPTNIEALINLISLFERTGATAARDELEQRLAGLRRHDPAYNYLLGAHAVRAGRYALAIPHLLRAARELPRTPDVFESLAEAYFGLNDARRASWALRRAQDLRNLAQQRQFRPRARS